MATNPSAFALVLLTIALVCVPAMEDQHAGVVSLGDSAVELLQAEPEQGGYDEIKGLVHIGPKSRKTRFLTSAECKGSCDADVKCESFSYDPLKKDCIASESSIVFNPNFKYYSRQPWLHKAHIDDDDGTNVGDVLGRYTVFTGLMYPEKARFAERFFVTLDKCKDLCDADAPPSVESNQRLGKFDHTYKYENDGCSAFSYSKEEERCLLKGVPISYNPSFNYYGKRSAMVEKDSTKGPEELKNDAKLDSELATQKKSADAAEKNDGKARKQVERNSEKKIALSVLNEQEKIGVEAKKAAKTQVSSEQSKLKAQAQVADPKPNRKEIKERNLKESTEKELEKETIMEAQDQRNADSRAKEQQGKEQVKLNREIGIKMAKKTKEVAAKAKAARLTGDMNSLLFEFLDRATLLANNERDLKAAIIRGQEHNSKESIVKSKVVSARSERREKGMVYDSKMATEAAAEGGTAAAEDAGVVADDEAKRTTAKNEFKVATEKLKTVKKRHRTTQKKVLAAKATLASLKGSIEQAGTKGSASLTQKLAQEEMKKGNLDLAAAKAKKAYRDQTAVVEQKKAKMESISPEIKEAKQAEALEKAKMEVAEENVKYEFYGDKPGRPTDEEAMLYRKYSKQYGLPLPEEPKDPKPAPPIAPGDEADEPKATVGTVGGPASEL